MTRVAKVVRDASGEYNKAEGTGDGPFDIRWKVSKASGPILGGVACFSTKYLVLVYIVELTGRELAHRTRAVLARGIS